MAQEASAPRGLPENSQFFLPNTNGRMAFSAANPELRITGIMLRIS